MQQQPPPLSYLQQSLNPQPLGQPSMSQQSLSQSMPQPMPQPMSQQSLSQQSLSQQSLAPQSMSSQPMNPQQLSQPSLAQQSLGQPSLSQQLQQQPMSQPPMAPSMTQSMSQQSLGPQSLGPQSLGPQSMPQSMSQPPVTQSVHSIQHNDTSILSQQSTPHPPPPPTLPPAPPPMPQVQKVQKVPQVQQLPQLPQVQQVVQPAQQQPPARQSEPVEPMQDNQQDVTMDVGSHDEDEGDSSLEPKMIDNSPFVPRQPMGPMMSAPPEGGSFPTLEAVHKHVLSYCTSVGYAVVIGRSKKTVPGLKKVLFVCDRAGKPPRRVSPEMRKRKTTSRKCDCQFGFFAIEQRTQWTVRYRPDDVHLQHNHGPSESPLLHPAARKLDSKMVAAVKKLKDDGTCQSISFPFLPRRDSQTDCCVLGVGVSQTLEILQNENPHVPLLPRDIYNARAAINRNPQKVATGLAENRPAIYSKPHPSAEERIRADLRRELATAREELDKLKKDSDKEIEELKLKLREKDKIIHKFEQFIDICNQRVMVSLNKDDNRAGGASAS